MKSILLLRINIPGDGAYIIKYNENRIYNKFCVYSEVNRRKKIVRVYGNYGSALEYIMQLLKDNGQYYMEEM